jgi:hypothetical protein
MWATVYLKSAPYQFTYRLIIVQLLARAAFHEYNLKIRMIVKNRKYNIGKLFLHGIVI